MANPTKYRKFNLNSKGFGLNDTQIAILDEILERHEFGLAFADRLELAFPTYHFQIGVIGAGKKVVKWQPCCLNVFQTDDGKYCVTRAKDSLQAALNAVVLALPAMFSHCGNPKYCYRLNARTVPPFK